MNAIKLVVFDIAGTTLKDGGEIALCFDKAMQQYGYTIPHVEIYPLMGYKKPEAIRMMLESYEMDKNRITPELIESIHRLFEREMINYYQNTPQLEALPHAPEVFAQLKQRGIFIGLDTGFSKAIADAIMLRMQWQQQGLVDYVVASDEVPKGRPHPYMIRRMMEACGITDPQQVVKVGDTEVDVMEGKNTGCRFSIAITTGAFTRQALLPYTPDFIIDSLSELIPLLEQHA
ncbi:MAG: HAD hydrolase-like protein [Chitinophagaceae bacterium]|nr:HAD hydrolase-like protein [Chitinophagaceae bacterium]